MLFQVAFDQFSYEEFYAFIRALQEKHNFWTIRFAPATNAQFFSEYQLEHAAPYHNVSHPGSFIRRWKENEDKVRRVSFSFKVQQSKTVIEMTVDLDNRTISLDSAVDILPDQIRSVLQSSFSHISAVKQPIPRVKAKRKIHRKKRTNVSASLLRHVERRYQVFISSTYKELKRERQAAVMGILGEGHIPAGMELIPGSDQSTLDSIHEWIDSSDIFVLILGARYGSIEPKSRLSYVELEYRYAVRKHIPFFAIVMTDGARKAKGQRFLKGDNQSAYRIFRDKVTKKYCALFTDARDIEKAVSRSLHNIIKKHSDHLGGWISAADMGYMLNNKTYRLSTAKITRKH
jgi:hypothetical protein